MKRVILESPYRAATWWRWFRNVQYAKKCMRHSLYLGEAPMLSHLLYTKTLDDHDPEEREWGIAAGLAWGEVADATIVYVDRGISTGMKYGIKHAQEAGRPIEYRRIEGSSTSRGRRP